MSSSLNRIKKSIMSAMQSATKKGTSAYDTTAVVRRIEGDTAWVHIAGGVDETPVKLTIAAKAGDSVQVRVGGGRAWITGNASAPPTDDGTAIIANANAESAKNIANNALKDANTAMAEANTLAVNMAQTVLRIDSDISDLQDQVDGNITTWFYAYVPTTSNMPASQWISEGTEDVHLGDLFYNTVNGYAYRWMSDGTNYSWLKITDTDVTKALADAAAAQDTADSKRRVFYTQPVPPYDKGDLWVQGSGGDILRCAQDKVEGQVYVSSDWVLASKYTDDTLALSIEQDLNGFKTTVESTYAAKSTVYTKSEINQKESSINASVSAKADAASTTASLALKANKDTLTSEINASADTVKINANRVNVDGTLIVGKSDVDSAINDLDIGGRNLLAFSELKQPLPVTWKGLTFSQEDDGWISIKGTANNTSATVQALWENDSSTTKFGPGTYTLTIEDPDGLFTSGKLNIQVFWNGTTGAKYYVGPGKKTFTENVTSYIYRVYVYFNAGANGTAYNGRFRLKMERGDKATDWAPAVEDVEANIIKASQSATKYITELGDSGIKVHPENDAVNYAKIDATGMEVYRNDTSIAEFGVDDNNVPISRIGPEGEANLFMQSSKVLLRKGITPIAKFYTSSADKGIIQLGSDQEDGGYNYTRLKGGDGTFELSTAGPWNPTSAIEGASLMEFITVNTYTPLNSYFKIAAAPDVAFEFNSNGYGGMACYLYHNGQVVLHGSNGDDTKEIFSISNDGDLTIMGHSTPIGTRIDWQPGTSSNISTGQTWTKLPSSGKTLTPGTYLVVGSLNWSANATGNRAARLYNETTGTALSHTEVQVRAATGATTRMQVVGSVVLESTCSICVQVWQDSGSTRTVTPTFTYTRIA